MRTDSIIRKLNDISLRNNCLRSWNLARHIFRRGVVGEVDLLELIEDLSNENKSLRNRIEELSEYRTDMLIIHQNNKQAKSLFRFLQPKW